MSKKNGNKSNKNVVETNEVTITTNQEEINESLEETTDEVVQTPVEITPVIDVAQPILKTVQDYIEEVKKLNILIIDDCITSLIDYSKTMNGKMDITESAGGQKQENLLAAFKKLIAFSGEHFKFVFSVFLMIIEDDLKKYGEQSAFSDSKKLRFLDKTTFDLKGKTAFKFFMNFLSDSCFVKDRSTVKVRINFEHLKPIFTKNYKEEQAEQFINKIKHFFI